MFFSFICWDIRRFADNRDLAAINKRSESLRKSISSVADVLFDFVICPPNELPEIPHTSGSQQENVCQSECCVDSRAGHNFGISRDICEDHDDVIPSDVHYTSPLYPAMFGRLRMVSNDGFLYLPHRLFLKPLDSRAYLRTSEKITSR